MFCPHCGAEIAAQAVCPACGQAVAVTPPPAPAKTSNTWIWLLVGCVVAPVLLAIVGILAAIVIPSFVDAMQRAKQHGAASDLARIGQAVEAYKAEHGFAPAGGDMNALKAALGSAGSGLPTVDPWRHPYRYGCWQEESSAGCDHYRVVSAGRDGRFEQDDLSAYASGAFAAREYDRDLVYGDGALLAAPAGR